MTKKEPKATGECPVNEDYLVYQIIGAIIQEGSEGSPGGWGRAIEYVKEALAQERHRATREALELPEVERLREFARNVCIAQLDEGKQHPVLDDIIKAFDALKASFSKSLDGSKRMKK